MYTIKFVVSYTYNGVLQEITFACMEEATSIVSMLWKAGYNDAITTMKPVPV